MTNAERLQDFAERIAERIAIKIESGDIKPADAAIQTIREYGMRAQLNQVHIADLVSCDIDRTATVLREIVPW